MTDAQDDRADDAVRRANQNRDRLSDWVRRLDHLVDNLLRDTQAEGDDRDRRTR